MQRGTVTTTIHQHPKGPRVRFSCPDDGYGIDDLDALEVALALVRRKLLEQQSVTPNSVLASSNLASAFSQQQSRMAAPS